MCEYLSAPLPIFVYQGQGTTLIITFINLLSRCMTAKHYIKVGLSTQNNTMPMWPLVICVVAAHLGLSIVTGAAAGTDSRSCAIGFTKGAVSPCPKWGTTAPVNFQYSTISSVHFSAVWSAFIHPSVTS